MGDTEPTFSPGELLAGAGFCFLWHRMQLASAVCGSTGALLGAHNTIRTLPIPFLWFIGRGAHHDLSESSFGVGVKAEYNRRAKSHIIAHGIYAHLPRQARPNRLWSRRKTEYNKTKLAQASVVCTGQRLCSFL